MKHNVWRALPPALAILLAGCNSLPRELKREITEANQRLTQTEKQFKAATDEITADLNHTPDLFTTVAPDWRSRLAAAHSKLASATSDRTELEKLEKSGTKEAAIRARQVLTDEEHLRKTALDEALSLQAQATYWLDFKQNLPHYLAKMDDEHKAIHSADFGPVTKTIEKAEQDWPAKNADLEKRLADLKSTPDRAESAWQSTAADRKAAENGQATGAQVAELIEANKVLAAAARIPDEATELTALSGQLYNAWDKILDDLDVTNRGAETVYREKLKTVRTHFAEAGDKSPQTATDVRWVDTTPAAYQSVENDLGMAISHKDAGLYDSEALNTPQPAGFAYIAPPSVGSNQYGYWTHNESGSFWTFLPQYLIMRELFWGHSYRPIIVNEYNGYYNSYRTGHTWYGQTSPNAPPRYGSQGTVTKQNYASSRYVQSGGFRNSSFSSHASPATSSPAAPHIGTPPSDNSQGKRFGHAPGPTPSGKRFGGGNSPSSGKRFGGGSRRR